MNHINFSYEGYRNLLKQIKDNDYEITDFHSACKYDKCVILRHDIDLSLEAALKIAEIENELGVRSTYCILLTGLLYNAFDTHNLSVIKRIASLGHELALHFDETRYPIESREAIDAYVQKEASVFALMFGIPCSVISMHRPSEYSLGVGGNFGDGLINAYSERFFKDFKYLSDSRMHWREDAQSIINEGEYLKIQLLTHPIWYSLRSEDIGTRLSELICEAKESRIAALRASISNFDELITANETLMKAVK